MGKTMVSSYEALQTLLKCNFNKSRYATASLAKELTFLCEDDDHAVLGCRHSNHHGLLL